MTVVTARLSRKASKVIGKLIRDDKEWELGDSLDAVGEYTSRISELLEKEMESFRKANEKPFRRQVAHHVELAIKEALDSMYFGLRYRDPGKCHVSSFWLELDAVESTDIGDLLDDMLDTLSCEEGGDKVLLEWAAKFRGYADKCEKETKA